MVFHYLGDVNIIVYYIFISIYGILFYIEYYRLLIFPLLNNNQKFNKYLVYISNEPTRLSQEFNVSIGHSLSAKKKLKKCCCHCHKCHTIFISKPLLAICLILHSMFYTIYYILYQFIGEFLCYGYVAREYTFNINHGGIPKALIMVISCIAWLMIIIYHGKSSMINNKLHSKYRKSSDFRNPWGTNTFNKDDEQSLMYPEDNTL